MGLFDDAEEKLKALQAQQTAYYLEEAEKIKNQHDFLTNLDRENLYIMKTIFSRISMSANPQAASEYWRGWCKAVLAVRFNENPVTGLDDVLKAASVDDESLNDFFNEQNN